MRRYPQLLALGLLAIVVVLAARGNAAALPPPGYIDTYAGGGVGDGGAATAASLDLPFGVAVDAAGDVYIGSDNDCRIRKVSGGTVTTYTGGNTLAQCTTSPDGTPIGSSRSYGGTVAWFGGTFYIGEFYATRTVSGGVLGTVPGSNPPYIGATTGIARDTSGDVYLAAPLQCVVVRMSGGVATIVAGTLNICDDGGVSGEGGLATSAKLGPQDVAIDGADDLFIADPRNCRIRRVSAGIITTVAGTGVCGYNGDGPALTSMLAIPAALAFDAAGDLILVDNCRLRRISNGALTTIAGSGMCAHSGDGGLATAATFRGPSDVAIGPGGEIYVVDRFACRVRQIVGGIITTFAGNGFCTWSGDGTAPTNAALNKARGLDTDASGDLYIADSVNCRIRKVSAGVIATIAGNGNCLVSSGDGGSPVLASFRLPAAVDAVPSGDLYIVDRVACVVRRISGGAIATVAGTGICGFSGDGGSATAARLNDPTDLVVTSAGDIYISDTANCRIRAVVAGMISTFAGSGNCNGAIGDGGLADAASLKSPEAVELDASGDVVIADTGHCRIRKVSAGVIGTIAGNGICGEYAIGAPATDAAIQRPVALAADGGGIFFATIEQSGLRCQVYYLRSGAVARYANGAACGNYFNGDGTPALGNVVLYSPRGLAVGAAGELFIGEDRRVRVVSAYLDGDGDGFGDEIDNCPSVANVTQLNNDRDLIDLTPPKSSDDITFVNADLLGDDCDADDDNDGLSDIDEASLPGPACPAATAATDPFNADSDGDRFLDGPECMRAKDPTNAGSVPLIANCGPPGDGDFDGVSYRVEVCLFNSNPANSNSDGANCNDGQEIATLNNDFIVNSGDQGLLASAIFPRPYVLDFDINKDGTINSGDQGFQASKVGQFCG